MAEVSRTYRSTAGTLALALLEKASAQAVGAASRRSDRVLRNRDDPDRVAVVNPFQPRMRLNTVVPADSRRYNRLPALSDRGSHMASKETLQDSSRRNKAYPAPRSARQAYLDDSTPSLAPAEFP